MCNRLIFILVLSASFDSQGRMWIGATNLNGPMTWVDGKPLSYTSWAGGQPASSKKILFKETVSLYCAFQYNGQEV
jgi:hypothetical protein